MNRQQRRAFVKEAYRALVQVVPPVDEQHAALRQNPQYEHEVVKRVSTMLKNNEKGRCEL